MISFLLQSAVRILLPVVSAVLVAVWVADQLGGWLGGAIATVIAGAMIAIWMFSGFQGDPARAGNPLIRIPRSVRLTIEATFVIAGVIVSAWGLNATAPAVLFGVLGAGFMIMRLRALSSMRMAQETRAAGETGSSVAATHEEGTANGLQADWAERGENGSFRFGRSFALPASRREVWDLIWNFGEVSSCIPGCEEVREITPQGMYEARVRKNVGPFLIRMALEIQVVGYDEPRSLRAVITGRDERLRSTVTQQLDLQLFEAGTECVVQTTLEVDIQGVLASVDGYLVERNLDQTIGEFAENLSRRLRDESATDLATGAVS